MPELNRINATSMGRTAEQDKPSGLIDQLLSFIKQPARLDYLLMDPSDERYHGYVAGIEDAMDFIVPALKEVVHLKAADPPHGNNCIPRQDVEKIVGRVPR